MKSILLSIFSMLLPLALFAQVNEVELFHTIKSSDSLLFDVGFNTCNMKETEGLISDHFEFYHDEAGDMLSKSAFIASMRDGVCKLPYRASRKLVEGSLEVYPLKKAGKLYGAVENGIHQFYAVEDAKPEYLTSTARFTCLWLLENGKWMLSRCLSYDHRNP